MSFVDSQGRDLLDSSHPANMVESYINYYWDGLGGLGITPDHNLVPHPQTGLRTIIVKSPPAKDFNDYGRRMIVQWAMGSHLDTITVTDADSLGQRFVRVNHSELQPLDGSPVTLSSDDAGFHYRPIEIPFQCVDVKGKKIDKPEVTAIIDGKEYPCDPEPRGELSIYSTMGLSWLFSNVNTLTTTAPEVSFTGLRIPRRVLWLGHKSMTGYENVVVLGDFPRNEPLDLSVTLRVDNLSQSDKPQLFDVKITNTVSPIADYISDRQKIVVDSADVSYEYYTGEGVITLRSKSN